MRVALTITATVLGMILAALGAVSWPVFALAYLAGGGPALIDGVRALRRGAVAVDLLMVIAAVGAAAIGAWAEGALLLSLFSLGGVLEELSLARTESAVASLVALRPAQVRLLDAAGAEREVAPEAVTVGQRIRILPGERVALDGRVAHGGAQLDLSALTGESVPVAVSAGDVVPAGAIPIDAPLDLTVTRIAAESTLARMIRLVAEARETTTRAGALIDRWLGRYVIAVLILTAAAYVALRLTGSGDAFLQAMTLLVVASPCALVIGLPATTLSALAAAARAGVLVKGAGPLLDLGQAHTVMFDKTGTLTTGRPRVVRVEARDAYAADDILAWAAAAEQVATHPLAEAVRAAAQGMTLPEARHPRVLPGVGVEAELAGIGPVSVLSPAAARSRGATSADLSLLENASGAVVYQGNRLAGVLVCEDPVRTTASGAVDDLRALGVRCEVLSGDRPAVAARVADAVGADAGWGDLTPEDKLERIRRAAPVVMVGDGINDAPALAAASVGVAMGARGTDAALEAGDVVLMGDRLERLVFLVELSRMTRRRLRQNMALGVGMILVLVAATLIGELPLPLGVLGHEGSTVLVTLNGLRLLGMRPPGFIGRRRCPGPQQAHGAPTCGRLATRR